MRRIVVRLIESDAFPFEFLSQLAERESWRKEIHRPIYHVHKWWAKRLGSVFRGILLGCILDEADDLGAEFYRTHELEQVTVFDPFMGSGTTIGEAHKLGCTALGRDINPVAVRSARVAFGPMNRRRLESEFADLSDTVGQRISALYSSKDSRGDACDVLYFFWVMQAPCVACGWPVDLFSSWVLARNAYPDRKPRVHVVCPFCADIFPARHDQAMVTCASCAERFDPLRAPAKGAKATCRECHQTFTILEAIHGTRPDFRLYGKLVLTAQGRKEYLPATAADHAGYRECAERLQADVQAGRVDLPTLRLEEGYNTGQAMRYGFRSWRDFFNDRQLLALGWLHAAIAAMEHQAARSALLTVFSGTLEFNNLFASYKGEGTGAVRHMFSHHILKPERTPIEAHVWGTPKSSGSFSNLFRNRLLRAIEYRHAPTEISNPLGRKPTVCARPFRGVIGRRWPTDGSLHRRAIYLSCGDSADTGLPAQSIDYVITDPPFFDNVHYSELADFFYAWQQLTEPKCGRRTTRDPCEVQDPDATRFAGKLMAVFQECRRVLKDPSLLVFTYHHSREEGWNALAEAILGAGFVVVNSQPVKAEMSVATPKSAAKEPIQLDIIVVCRKQSAGVPARPWSVEEALSSARSKLGRLRACGFRLSRNDRNIVVYGQLLTALGSAAEIPRVVAAAEREMRRLDQVEHEASTDSGSARSDCRRPRTSRAVDYGGNSRGRRSGPSEQQRTLFE